MLDWRVVPWEDDRVARLVSVRHGKKGYLAHALNYARFYLRDILPDNVEKALWLDSDTVVIGDVTTMTTNALTTSTHAVAAVAREKKACGSAQCCGTPLRGDGGAGRDGATCSRRFCRCFAAAFAERLSSCSRITSKS